MGLDVLDSKLYVSQKALIIRENKVLVLRDAEDKDLDFPGGKYRWGNDIKEEFHREIKEETGLEIAIGKPFTTWTAEHGNGTRQIFLIGYLCEYINGEVELSDEHSEFEWVDKVTYKKWQENSGYFKALEEYFKGA